MTRLLSHFADFDDALRELCFSYFYWFSRLEFALKENDFGSPGRFGEAQVDWRKYIDTCASDFKAPREGRKLLADPPKWQTYQNGRCGWQELNLDREATELGKVVLIAKTIRNNLFHGGKASQADWDDPGRNLFLLRNGKAVLDVLAKTADIESDYLRRY